jgi:death-on-curing protein
VSEWAWVSLETAKNLHLEQLSEHGGGAGVRDRGLFESAMMRPQNLAAYGEPDAALLAASYAFGIAKNHPFIDGNKRTALVVSFLFLAKNGWRVISSDAELLAVFLDLAAGEISEDELAAWFRERITRLKPS